MSPDEQKQKMLPHDEPSLQVLDCQDQDAPLQHGLGFGPAQADLPFSPNAVSRKPARLPGYESTSTNHQGNFIMLYAVYSINVKVDLLLYVNVYNPHVEPEIKLKDVTRELSDFCGWYQLGIYLETPKGVLDKFHANFGNSFDASDRCKIEALSYWLRNAEHPSWSALVAALHAMGEKGRARKIARRYGRISITQLKRL